MLPASLACLILVFAQEAESIATSPFDRVIELEITERDEPAIEGRGPTAFAEYDVQFGGKLHVWATSELDLILRLDDAAEARTLASDDNSGGGTTPYLSLDVEPGDWLVVLVAGDPGATGPLTLHLIATPESEAGRLAETAARNALRESRRLVSDGKRAAAREVMAEAMPEVVSTTGPDQRDLIVAREDLAVSMHQMGDSAGARTLFELVLAGFEHHLPADHSDVLAARANLAVSMDASGDVAEARALRESVLAAYERLLPEDHPDLLRARGNLAGSIQDMGDLDGARALYESALAGYERTRSADDPDLLSARGSVAFLMSEMGDLAGAHALRESVVAGCERALPEDHPDLLHARGNLAASMSQVGDLAGARALRESVLAGFRRILPEGHPDVLSARGSLAGSMSLMGELGGARALRESVLVGYERILPEDHPDVLSARAKLATSMADMGDLAGARALDESLLNSYERILPEDHPDLLSARGNLAVSMSRMGDLAGARALRESVLAAYERILSEDHPDLLIARGNLAVSMNAMGDFRGAYALRESLLAAYERTLPADHPDLLGARANMASSMLDMGDLAGAHALGESVLADCERVLPRNHPNLLRVKANLAGSTSDLGDFAGARALYESALAGYERIVPEGHPELLKARSNLAVSMLQTDDLAEARSLLPKLVAGLRLRILASLALAPRQARQTVASESTRYSDVLLISESAGPEFAASVFSLTETMRLVVGEAARSLARFESDAELRPILEEAAEVRRALNDLVAGADRKGAGAEELAAELTRLSLRRDRLERDASQRLAQRGVVTQPVEVDRLSQALGSGEVAIGYRRSARWEVDQKTGRLRTRGDHLIAHVLGADGELNQVDLGSASDLEELASAWRAALGAPIGIHGTPDAVRPSSEAGTPVADASRGIAPEAELGGDVTEATELDAGHLLRERILDPVLAVAKKDVRRIFVCADDLLFLLPLDALPLEAVGDGAARVGDRLQVVSGVSFARLLAPPPTIKGDPSLLSMGGVDYDATGAASEGGSAVSAPIEPGAGFETGDRATRSATGTSFQTLLQAGHEAEATATLFEGVFERAPTLLTGKQTTKAALFESVPGKRYLHLATHGWFAPESVRSTEDAQPAGTGFARMGIEDRVSGLAPMTLCGLALAGANRGRDSLGRVPGILTAEELCSLDLSQCELAVLSACETNVGIRRAGQGIQSLQSALYAAGARTSITSLWKVDDAATRRLMEVFYTNLWIEKMGKAEALWQAKQALRDEGHPPAHWAGWVLTGDPD